MVSLLAQLIGVSITVVIKLAVLYCLRRKLFAGFYRKSPAQANCFLVVIECWNLALTILSMLQRLIKVTVVAAFNVGRLDTPILAKGIGNIGPVQLDDYPIHFRRDLLIHEAHRHPYMERLGVMYMLKLRHGDNFSTRAGSAWRLIFCMALMPWLRRFRFDESDGAEIRISPEQQAIDGIRLKSTRSLSFHHITSDVGHFHSGELTGNSKKDDDTADQGRKKKTKEGMGIAREEKSLINFRDENDGEEISPEQKAIHRIKAKSTRLLSLHHTSDVGHFDSGELTGNSKKGDDTADQERKKKKEGMGSSRSLIINRVSEPAGPMVKRPSVGLIRIE